MYKVEPFKALPGDAHPTPYVCRVDGWTLIDKLGRPRRFKDSINAAIAGAKHVDRLRAMRLAPAETGAEHG